MTGLHVSSPRGANDRAWPTESDRAVAATCLLPTQQPTSIRSCTGFHRGELIRVGQRPVLKAADIYDRERDRLEAGLRERRR